LFKEKCVEFKVKRMRSGQDKYRGEESIAVPSDGGAEGCRSYLGREFQSTEALWVKELSVILRRERTEGRWRVMMSEERVVRLD